MAVEGSLRALLAQALRAAQRRGHDLSTAHALLIMVQNDVEAGEILATCGARETDIASALKVVDEERQSALEVAVERAYKLAARENVPARPVHLLAAIAREPRTAGYRCLEMMGAMTMLRDTISERFGKRSRSSGVTAPREQENLASAPKSIQRKNTVARTQRGPDAEVKTRLARRDVERLPTLPSKQLLRSMEDEKRLETGPTAPLEIDRAAVHDIDAGAFPVLASLGRNLSALAARNRLDPVVGRDNEMERVLDVLSRRRGNHAVLVGPNGVGKTVIVEGLVSRLVRGELNLSGTNDVLVIEASLGAMIAGTGVRGAVAERVRQLRAEIERFPRPIFLFIDDIHTWMSPQEGPDDLAHEISALLSGNTVRCIATTTEAAYRRHFERDVSLGRKFSRVTIDEPTCEVAEQILRSVVPHYATHHAVEYAEDALLAAVELSARFLSDRCLPEKAISLLDMAGARAKRQGTSTVTQSSIAETISAQVRVPLSILLMRDSERLLGLQAELENRIVGQKRPIERISRALRKASVGFRGKRPLGTFLLLGPTGVGKTEMAKVVSEVLFPASGMSRFDMHEYSESHAVAKLFGAPPGYVGHEEGGQLVTAVRQRPYQLILLDEIEKAHPDVLLSLLSLLDEGHVTDGRGRKADFTNTVVMMTSNLGSSITKTSARLGFGEDRAETRDLEAEALASARQALPAELWNRIDEPLYFGPLSADEVGEIATKLLSEVENVLRDKHGVRLHVERSAVQVLIQSGGYDPLLGARPMRRTIARLVEAPIADAILERKVETAGAIRLYGEDNALRIDFQAAAEAAE